MTLMLRAWDKPGDDGAALRRSLIKAHGENVAARRKSGELLLGMGIYDDAGVIRGSVMVLDLPSIEAVHEFVKTEPLHVGGAWERYEVTEVFLPDVYGDLLRTLKDA